uniref:Uncharacterized protein n=1 Tax=Nelumbo nucifera TaxID=4432 RepID=A0A822ZGL3_NELNU|nr:TPA_asm: hypothetical protein HUJ06_002502 [Nelumbo nucifera]
MVIEESIPRVIIPPKLRKTARMKGKKSKKTRINDNVRDIVVPASKTKETHLAGKSISRVLLSMWW